mmetsp:Transcript_40419/g.72625  ORF Transcript_40419/g.72625 Transcript_40419/m.72625 type:complete len:471 (-) Transcript_40419:182-1594(-)|eukprot:CAMPEP_0197625878 /NCGR_PEP_ID=MMETSP1338-20131121/5111_1 /TAXON_ID=43686 ORGANISM="Pelagodinium beii, Strain RCC1491" /NCGR_SAMPLE_ID=MMETSP1338 /ASSEMBLY_ACC=CAM_ASM_000754 /LENGTH=470 /DNA_ID=CAMNT_0043196387 /DNA_START=61 /DNA_END=1473 /DNA_ORIENTATION=+
MDKAAQTAEQCPTLLGAEQPGPQKAMRAFSSALAGSLFDEKLGQKLNQTVIVAFLRFKKPLELEQTRNVLLSRLCAIPRFRSRAVNTAQGEQRPVMAFEQLDDTSLKTMITDLVRDHTGMVQSEADVNQFVTALYGARPDVNLPLWRAFIFNSMDDGRSMLMLCVDHAIADGVALVQTLISVLDEQPELALPTRAVKSPSGCLTQLKGLIQACWGPFVGDQLPGDPKNKLKATDCRNVGKIKAVCQTPDIDIASIREVKNKLPDATINDVLMATASLTLQEYFRRYEPSTLHQKVRGNFPIDMRPVTGSDIVTEEHYGNRFSQGQLRFPLHLEDPLAIFEDIKSQIDVIKVSPEPFVRDKLLNFVIMSSSLPYESVGDMILDAYGKVTMTLSNVPGPLSKVKLLDQELDDLSFYALTCVGLYFGIVQYDGKFKAGLCCDASLEPEPQKLAECWLPAFERLRLAAMKQHPR